MTPDEKRAAIVAAVVGEIGRGPADVDRYWSDVGISPSPKPGTKWGHWCGAFALWGLHRGDVAVGTDWKTGIGFIYPLRLPVTKSPKPGDVLYKDAPFQHYGIVESFENGILVSVEGNTPDVERVTRTNLAGLTFYSIEKLLGAPAAPVTPTKKTAEGSPAPGAQSKATVTKTAPAPAASDTGATILGIDVSSWQTPSAINYAELAKTHKFVIARATYGTKLDARFQEHIARARDAGLVVGAYHFFRPQQGPFDQAEAFGEAVEAAGIGPGWIVPAIDLEQNVANDGPVARGRYDDPSHAIVDLWAAKYGTALVYTSISMWAEIGNPEWLRDYQLWIANYGVREPRTPFGLEWAIWQHTGEGKLPGVHAGILDLNIANSLPLIGGGSRETPTDPAPPLELAVDWDDITEARDRAVQENDE